MATRELFFNSEISRRGFLGLGAAATASILLAGCSSGESSSSSTDASTSTASEVETSTIKWARANSGNVFVTIASEKGYFAEYGLTVEENPVNTASDALTSLANGQVDVTSNQGASMPLQYIAEGNDFTIVGGYMLKGMYIVSKKDTEFKDVNTLAGAKVALSGQPHVAICSALLDAGYDPLNDVEWLTYSTNTDSLAAVVAGEAEFGVLSGDLLFNVGNMDDIKIATWVGDLMPNYGCCRMNMRSEFVKENPNTMSALMKSLLKAECYFNQNKEECVSILAKAIGADEDYVSAYLMNENYVPSVDPVKNQVLKSWNVMLEVGYLDESAKNVDIESHIDTSYYKNALDELLAEAEGADKTFYEERVEFFKENDE